jgi:hypothetical protein
VNNSLRTRTRQAFNWLPIFGKRLLLLSITHILCSEEEAEVDIGEAGETLECPANFVPVKNVRNWHERN